MFQQLSGLCFNFLEHIKYKQNFHKQILKEMTLESNENTHKN